MCEEAQMVCVERGVLSIYTRSKSGAMAILGVKSQGAPPQHAHMPPPIEGMAERCRWGSPAPKGQPPPDQAPLPPPSCGRLWAGPGLLLGWYFRPDDESCWAFLLFVCANQSRKAPFSEMVHAFVFMSCKIITSKYMWN